MKYPHALFLAVSDEQVKLIKCRWEAFSEWAKDNLGQSYSLDIDEDGMIQDKTTRWAFSAFVAGIRYYEKRCLNSSDQWSWR